MIATQTPCQATTIAVPRRHVPLQTILESGAVPIHQYNYLKSDTQTTFRDIEEIRSNIICPKITLTTFLWKIMPFLKWPRPNWSGFMQMVQTGEHPGKASVLFLPLINLDPTDMSCVYSTLIFLTDQAEKRSTTPVR